MDFQVQFRILLGTSRS
uniref:Uncharacterized protein n=1 Tax=Rhizophora mucronata TaxID=61149 RepID=A0A2P2PNS4_RHIMU